MIIYTKGKFCNFEKQQNHVNYYMGNFAIEKIVTTGFPNNLFELINYLSPNENPFARWQNVILED